MSSDASLKKFQARMRAIPKAARDAVIPALERSAEEIADTARALVPVDDGDLEASIDWQHGPPPPESRLAKSTGGDPSLMVTVFAGNDEVFWAPFVEFGTQAGIAGQRVTSKGAGNKQSKKGRLSYRTHPGTPAQPFFYPAYRLNKTRIERRIKRAVAKAIRETKR
ncbi:MAG: HK97 gp10 family phage protein [Roseovarius sp.]|uniref:HK97-gp10 family putative phage morphogenesis protein n=1 Tax=Hoeflea sp. TaxID=1940281 RepID=UPI0032EB9E3E